jgi:hypothetical protein
MAFSTNESQQYTLDDSFYSLNERTKKIVLNSWAKAFADIIFPAINEQRFAILYSDIKASRPNNPVNTVVAALMLKEMFNLTDDELFNSILCDVRYQYALHTTSFTEQPFSDRTFSRFRERNYLHTLKTGEDLLHQEMEAMAQIFANFMNINPTLKRMDSVMISSSCKKMSRLEILYTCVANMVKAVHRTGEDQYLKDMEHYLEADDCNAFIYHRRNEDISTRLEQVIADAVKLVEELGESFFELPEYQLLLRVLYEQADINTDGKIIPKDKKNISPDSLHNPSDPDATYRSKARQSHIGYVGNFIETFDEKGAIITAFDYQVNSHTDTAFCRETIEKLGLQEHELTLIADGGYASAENTELAEGHNINLITTTLTGKIPNVIFSGFQIDTEKREVLICPNGNKPYQTTYHKATEMYRANFVRSQCENCSHREDCNATMQRESAFVIVSTKMIQRASYLVKLSTEEYKSLSKKRNGVEGIPSVLRRKYDVDHIPVKGLVRSKIWYSFKIGAINAKRVIKRMASMSPVIVFITKSLNIYLYGLNNLKIILFERIRMVVLTP